MADTHCTLDSASLNLSLGGGLSVQSGGQAQAMGLTSISLNSACVGGGVHLDGGVFSGGDVSGNSAVYGGGFAVGAASGTSTGQLDDTTVRDNAASQWGGAGLILGTLDASRAQLIHNVATEGAGLYIAGLLLLGETSTAALTDCAVTGNDASVQGGGALLFRAAELQSIGTSWGTDGEDNTPDDIDIDTLGGRSYDTFGDGEDFTCSTDTLSCL